MIYNYESLLKKKIFGGNKINNLLKLYGKYNIPNGFIILDINKNLYNFDYNEILNYISNYNKYIIRSSANIEDGINSSFAGLFNSMIFRKNKVNKFIDNVNKLLDSIDYNSINYYLKYKGINKQIKLNLLIQEFIYGDYSGVYFSKYNGKELIEYIKGPNSLLVNGYVNSSKIIIDKNNYNIELYKQEYYLDFDLNNKIYEKIPTINNNIIINLIDNFRSIRKLFNFEVDIEWTLKGNKLYILQIRPITKC